MQLKHDSTKKNHCRPTEISLWTKLNQKTKKQKQDREIDDDIY